MAEANVGYEIYTHDFKRWELCGLRPTAASAINEANRLYKLRRLRGVKVVRVQEKRTGFIATRTVHQQYRDEERRHIILSDDFDASIQCHSLEDIFSHGSLNIINRVLRAYLDDQCITATELLHGHLHAKRLANHGSLRYRALSIIASVQTKSSGGNPHARIKDLDALCDKVLRRARKAMDNRRIPELEPGFVGQAYADLDARCEPQSRDYLFLAGLTVAVSGAHTWPHKLERTLSLFGGDVSGGALKLLDRFIADILAGAGALHDLFGVEPDLCTAVCHLADLSHSRLQRSYDMSGVLVDLNRVMAARAFTACRVALESRIVQSLEGVAPLTRGDSREEIRALREIVSRLYLNDRAVSAAPSLYAAVEERSARHAQPEIDRLSEVHRIPEERIPALLDLCDHLIGARAKAIVLENIELALRLAHTTGTLTSRQNNAADKLRLIAQWRQRVAGFGFKTAATQRLIQLLDEFAGELPLQETLVQGR